MTIENLTGTLPACPMGFPMNQNRMAIPVWSYAIEKHQPRRLIELGSYNGGFAIVMAFAGWTSGLKVHSFDQMEAPSVQWQQLARSFGVQFYRGDIFEQEQLIERLIRASGRCFLLCDGGDKIREFNTFAKYLKPGDVIGVHDVASPYWRYEEVQESDLSEELNRQGLNPWMHSTFCMAGWLAYLKPDSAGRVSS